MVRRRREAVDGLDVAPAGHAEALERHEMVVDARDELVLGASPRKLAVWT